MNHGLNDHIGGYAEQNMQQIGQAAWSPQRAQEEAVFQQKQCSALVPPPPPIGVIGMTESAHCAFQALSQAINELQDRLGPMTESYPEPGCGSSQNQLAEAPAVVALRILVERIDGKTAEIHRLLAALRI